MLNRVRFISVKKLTDHDWEEIVRRYEMGETLRDLAPEIECHEKTVARWLRKYGACIRNGPSPVPPEVRHANKAPVKPKTKPKRRIIEGW
jgi:hypothetical protein